MIKDSIALLVDDLVWTGGILHMLHIYPKNEQVLTKGMCLREELHKTVGLNLKDEQ